MFVFFLLDLILFSLLTTRSLSIEQGVRTARTIEGTDLSSIACLRRKDALEQKIARNLLRRSQSSTTSAAVMFRIPANVNRKSVITPSLIRFDTVSSLVVTCHELERVYIPIIWLVFAGWRKRNKFGRKSYDR